VLILYRKKDEKVIKYYCIESNSSYALEMPNGTNQKLFYYKNGWNPQKILKEAERGVVKGGII